MNINDNLIFGLRPRTPLFPPFPRMQPFQEASPPEIPPQNTPIFPVLQPIIITILPSQPQPSPNPSCPSLNQQIAQKQLELLVIQQQLKRLQQTLEQQSQNHLRQQMKHPGVGVTSGLSQHSLIRWIEERKIQNQLAMQCVHQHLNKLKELQLHFQKQTTGKPFTRRSLPHQQFNSLRTVKKDPTLISSKADVIRDLNMVINAKRDPWGFIYKRK